MRSKIVIEKTYTEVKLVVVDEYHCLKGLFDEWFFLLFSIIHHKFCIDNPSEKQTKASAVSGFWF